MATALPRRRACIPARLGLEPANKTLLHHLRLLATTTRPPRQYPKREETFAHRQPNLPTRRQLEEEDDLGPEAVLMDLAREGFKRIGRGPKRWCVCVRNLSGVKEHRRIWRGLTLSSPSSATASSTARAGRGELRESELHRSHG
jgi:hypothetical protein